jgi:hypothetical protein
VSDCGIAKPDCPLFERLFLKHEIQTFEFRMRGAGKEKAIP